ncbi:zinc finger CCHC domain-containing protein 10 [Ricinus communis]|uniref:Uncharacterized protein n=1 Tax=Ricinus communis TaxID=3988 RepID=B9RYH6_RICCO|nr:zinc finger CCHC domain-containing protein 10 [Ricinus communis]EEF43685.1 conserved hypothetical protein [Ricinus communis]|eukprot:XP_002518760.1 zinc finger CCHC domain-containing protein 10 [Ricinus communis]
MSNSHESRLPELPQPRLLRPLYKQMSWSPDTEREENWLRRKSKNSNRRNKSVTADDLEELKGCIELGFGFGHEDNDLDPKLFDALPALGFYCAVNKHYSNSLSRSSSSSSILSDIDTAATSSASSSSSSSSIVDPGDEPEMVKMKLKQWAVVVACSVRQNSGKSD